MITVVYSTRNDSPTHIDHIKKSAGLGKNIEVIQYINNGEYSLTELYNRGLKEATHNIVVFCHDDIKFNGSKWGKKLINHFNSSDYGILGVAGTTDIPSSGRWWEDNTKMVGIVKHSHEGKTWESKYSANFSDKIIETTILDGLFFAVNQEQIKKGFDENIKGFHFYDIDFTFRNHLSKVKIGVIFNIRITHLSIGMTNTEWDKNRVSFSDTHKEILPYKLKGKILYESHHIKLKSSPLIGIIIPTKGNVDMLLDCINSIYEKDNYSNIIIYIADTGSSEDELIRIGEFINTHSQQFGHRINLIKYDYYHFGKINNDVVTNHVTDEVELLLFCNNDIQLINNAITRMVNTYLKNNKIVGTIGCRLHFGDNRVQHSGMELFLQQDTHNKSQFHILITHHGINSYYNYYTTTRHVVGNTGAFLLISKKLFNNINQFSEEYIECFEDVELNMECLKNNKKNIFVEDAVCYHLESQTRNQDTEKNKKMAVDFNKLTPYIIKNKKTYDYFTNVNPYIINQIFTHGKLPTPTH